MKTIRFAFITLAVLVGACVRAPYYGGPTGQGHTSPIPPGWQGCGSDYQCSNGCCCPTPWPASWLGTGGSECEACVSGACQQP